MSFRSQMHYMFLSVGAILEHEAIAGLSAAVKPSGLGQRARAGSSSNPNAAVGKEQALDALMRAVCIYSFIVIE